MTNCMVMHHGAIGDHVFSLPALRLLREQYDRIWLYCNSIHGIVKSIFANTDIISCYVYHHTEMDDWTKEEARAYLISETMDVTMDKYISFRGVVCAKYIFRALWPCREEPDPGYWWSQEVKCDNADGVSFFDEFAIAADMSEAVGQRPCFVTDHAERGWLRDFRFIYNIPRDAFLLGWIYTGSGYIKQYPHMQQVLYNVMTEYPNVYVVGYGDRICEGLTWKGAGDRYINLAGKLTWRQAALSISLLDCLVGPETSLLVAGQAYPETPKVLLATHTTGAHISFPETVILQSEAGCAPCYNIVDDCIRDGNNEWSLCIGKIAPERIVAAITDIVGVGKNG